MREALRVLSTFAVFCEFDQAGCCCGFHENIGVVWAALTEKVLQVSERKRSASKAWPSETASIAHR